MPDLQEPIDRKLVLVLDTRDRQKRLDQLIHDMADTLGVVAFYDPKANCYRFRAEMTPPVKKWSISAAWIGPLGG